MRHAAPLAALQANGKELSQDSEEQHTSQIRAALQKLLPGYRQGGPDAQVQHEAVPETSLIGTRAALLAANDQESLARREELLKDAYEQCRQITAQYAKTFYLGTSFFAEEKRKAVWAVYAWCRRTDDIVDKPRKETVSLRNELAEWKQRTANIWRGVAHDVIDLALVDTVERFPDLSVQPFNDMIKVLQESHMLHAHSSSLTNALHPVAILRSIHRSLRTHAIPSSY